MSTTSYDFDTASAKMTSDFNRTRNIMIASFVSIVVLMIIASACRSEHAKRARREEAASHRPTPYRSHGDGVTRIAYEPSAATMASSAFNYTNTNDDSYPSIPFAQAVTIDMTPSAPAFESSSSACAPASSSSGNC